MALGGEETKHERRAVELTEPAPESGVGDEAAPALADEGGADEARRVVRREAEEVHLNEVSTRAGSAQPRRRHASQIDVTEQAAAERGFFVDDELHVTCNQRG